MDLPVSGRRPSRLAVALSPIALFALLALLSACASVNTPADDSAAAKPALPRGVAAAAPRSPAPSASGVPPGTPQPAVLPPGSPQTFANMIKDAQPTEGLLKVYQKSEKVWLALKPEDFGKPFFLSPKLATGIGEANLYGGRMDDEHLVEFRRVHNLVQMIALNTEYTAQAGSPEGRAVAAGFSPSLLASTPVASQPDPESKAVLVDASALFVNDLLGIASQLQRSFRQGYAFDGRNSAITRVRQAPSGVVLEVLEHFATASITPRPASAPPGAPVPRTPTTLPDPRSLFVTASFTLGALPAVPMAARLADPRVGYFTSTQWDFSNDLSRTPIVRHVNRWRLEKKDPAAPLSEPVTPIVYWLDRTIPLQYRDAIASGVLEWNKAFERIGFKEAIQVKVQPGDATWDTLDGGASIRWLTNASPGFGAIGPSHVDPRSGEILAANIGIESLSSRARRASRAQILTGSSDSFANLMQFGGAASGVAFDARVCLDAEQSADQLGYGLDVLAARDGLDPSGPQAQQFVLAYLKDVTMHEVGHTLGLRHNFRASRLYTDKQLSDPEFTRSHALTGSVMEYAPINLASPGAPEVAPFQTTLGPYDYWAIAYAYEPLKPTDEPAALERIAARSNEPAMAFGTDEDNFLGIDPDALQFDLGSDPAVFAAKRLAIARDLFKRQETRTLARDHDYAVLRRSLNFAVNDVARATGVLARQIGGVRTLRDFPGSGRDPLQPVPAAQQRLALDQISRSVFAADSLVVSPALQRRLAPDFDERNDALELDPATVATDYVVTDRVLGLQKALLGQLMSDAVAVRILDSQGKTSHPGDALQLSELYNRLGRDIWSELDADPRRLVGIPAPRRALQREHVNRITASLLQPGSAGRADARSLMRAQARALLARLNAADKRRGLDADTRAHLQDSADTLSQALAARIVRPGA